MKQGDKPRDRPQTHHVRPLIEWFKSLPGNSCGGCLHIATDDGNLKDSHLEFCVSYAAKRKDRIAAFVGLVLLKMTITQRKAVT